MAEALLCLGGLDVDVEVLELPRAGAEGLAFGSFLTDTEASGEGAVGLELPPAFLAGLEDRAAP